MSDLLTPCATDDGAPISENAMTAGAMLRQARVSAGLHVAALAVSMKVPVKKLEALEADRLHQQLDAVFVRALAASVCRALKIDPHPVLEKLPKSNAPALPAQAQGIGAPFQAGGEVAGFSLGAVLKQPVAWFVAVVLLGVVVILMWPQQVATTPAPFAQTPVPVVASPAQPLVIEEVVVPATEPEPLVAAPVPVPPPSASVVAPTPAPTPLPVPAPAPLPAPIAATTPVATTPTVATASATEVVAAPPVVKGTVVFKAKGTSWIEVIDATGAVQLRRTLSAGDSVGASGALPLSVVIGSVDAMDVLVRGKPFALAPISMGNVARFEVK